MPAEITQAATQQCLREPPRARHVSLEREPSSVKSKLDVLMDLEWIRDPRVVPFLLRVLRNPDESYLRYAALTSIERAGPTPDCIPILREIARDEILGDAARSVLTAWRIAT